MTFFLLRGFHPPPLARPFSKGLPTSDYLTVAFTPLRGSILRLWRGPSPRAYSLRDYLTFAFIPLRGSILRLRRAPSLRGYSLRTTSLSHRFEDPYSAFSAPPSLRGYPLRDYLTFAFTPLRGFILRLWHGPSPRGYSLRTTSLSLSHRFEDPSSAFGAPLL